MEKKMFTLPEGRVSTELTFDPFEAVTISDAERVIIGESKDSYKTKGDRFVGIQIGDKLLGTMLSEWVTAAKKYDGPAKYAPLLDSKGKPTSEPGEDAFINDKAVIAREKSGLVFQS